MPPLETCARNDGAGFLNGAELLGIGREMNRYCEALAGIRCGDKAPVLINCPFRDRKAETVAAGLSGARRINPIELAEQFVQFGFLHARAAIVHTDGIVFPYASETDLDSGVIGCVFQRVTQDIFEGLFQ